MNTTKINKISMIIILVVISLSSFISISAITPEGPNITIINTTTRTPTAASTLEAYAGNITQIDIIGTTVTQTWQGYFGNITGTITLDDSRNNTLYNWDLASPEGEVYASTSTIDFSSGNILCFNYSDDVPAAYTTLSELESSLGADTYDADGVNETFSDSLTHTSFYTSVNLIDGTSSDTACPTVRLFNSTEESTAGLFEEVLLYDKTNHKVIYTSILEDNEFGFTNEIIDFQMIVGEDGHSGDTTTTTYYFYVELE